MWTWLLTVQVQESGDALCTQTGLHELHSLAIAWVMGPVTVLCTCMHNMGEQVQLTAEYVA